MSANLWLITRSGQPGTSGCGRELPIRRLLGPPQPQLQRPGPEPEGDVSPDFDGRWRQGQRAQQMVRQDHSGWTHYIKVIAKLA